MSILKLINEVKQGDKQAYITLLEKFQPLIYKWLRQSTELYQKEKDDYESMAKIILYECAIQYQEGRGVPFESFYKIKLYHWYANQKKKKVLTTTELQPSQDHTTNLEEIVLQREKKLVMNLAIKSLSEKERHIILRYLEGFTDEQISQELQVSKKTIQNYRYTTVKKLTEIVIQNYEDFYSKIKPCTDFPFF